MNTLPNPYVSRGPLRQPGMFFGRETELRQIAAFLSGSQSVAVIGPDEIGKSSLLFHLLRPETRRALGLGEEFLLAYVDCEVFGEMSSQSVLAQFAAEMAAALSAGGLPTEPALEEAAHDPGWLTFEAAIRCLSGRGLRPVLLLDEFQHLSANPGLDLAFFNALGSAAVRHGLSWLVASNRPLLELDRTRTNPTETLLTSPFITLFATLFLGLLSETDARRLICVPSEKAGVRFPQATQDFLYDLAGGHPEALQIACFHAFEAPGDLSEIERRALEELEEHFQAAWLGLSLAEQGLLRGLSSLPAHTNDTTLRGALRGLGQKGLLLASPDGYRYPSRAWASFVAARPAAPTALPSAPSTGWRFGAYEIIELLGRGGMAEVYKGRHTRLDRLVAVKILSARMADDEDFRQRFEREARAVAALRHPNIVQVFDFGEVDGNSYIVMEYIGGKDLGKYIKENGPLSLEAAGPILRDLASALDYAHALGIVHRDIKPSNVLIQFEPPNSRAFLSDFGIAKILRSDTSSTTKTGLMMGTLSYMAPEQIRSAAGVDARADMYSLGVLLYQMFTGALPFSGDNPGTVMLQHLSEPAPDPLVLRPDLPARTAAAILRCLAKEPGERFASAGELIEAIGVGEKG